MVPMSARSLIAARGEYRLRADGNVNSARTALSLLCAGSGEHRLPLSFAGGLVADVLWGVGCMLVTLVVAKRRNYQVSSPSRKA